MSGVAEIAALGPRDVDDLIRADDLRTRWALRAAFRRSLFLVSKIITSWNEPKNLMSAATFKERQDWIQDVVCDKKRGLLEDPRGYIKSSGCTRTIPLFVLIQRPNEELDAPTEYERALTFLETHLHLKGPDSRLLIMGDTESNAARFTGSTLSILNTNPLFRWLYPEFIWPNPLRRDYRCEYNSREWTPNGRLNTTEANNFVRAAGAETAIVGGRADGEVFNDLIGEHNCNSRTEIERQRDFIKTAPFLLENRDPKSPEGGFIMVEGNRWLLDDVNSMIHDEYPDWAIWRRSVLKCYVHGAGNCGRWGSDDSKLCAPTTEPIWPERHPDMAAIERLIADVNDPVKVAAQLFNDPAQAADLDAAKMHPFYVEVRPVRDDRGQWAREWCVIAKAPQGNEEILPISSLERHIISVDPAASAEASAARTAISWLARDRATGRRFHIELFADRWAADSGRAEAAILDMHKLIEERAHQRPTILIEKVAAQMYLAAALKRIADAQNVRLGQIVPIKPAKGVVKEDRIRRRVGFILGQDLLYVRAGLQLPRTEARHFPTATLDVLDTIAQAEEVYQEIRTSTDSRRLRAARMRRRELRLMASGPTGAPI